MRVVSTIVLSSVALHAWLETIAEAASAVNETSNNRVAENKHDNYVQELERDVETPDDDERMMNVFSPLFWRSPKKIFMKIRAGNPEESDPAKMVDDVISTMKHKLTSKALSEKKLLIKHFVKSWGDDVVAMALVKARNSKDKHIVETTKTLSRQLMKYWHEANHNAYEVFEKLKLDKDSEHLGFTDGRMAVLDDFITFKKNGVPDDDALTRSLQRYFESDMKLAWYYRGVTASDAGTSQRNEVKKRFVWTMACEGDLKYRFVRLELHTGAVQQLEKTESTLDLSKVPQQDVEMAKYNELFGLFGSENDFAELVLRAKKATLDDLSVPGKYYEELVLQRLKLQKFPVANMKDFFSANGNTIDTEVEKLQSDFKIEYDKLVGLDEDPVKVFMSRRMEKHKQSLPEEMESKDPYDQLVKTLSEFAEGDLNAAEIIIRAMHRKGDIGEEAKKFMRPLFKRLSDEGINPITFESMMKRRKLRMMRNEDSSPFLPLGDVSVASSSSEGKNLAQLLSAAGNNERNNVGRPVITNDEALLQRLQKRTFNDDVEAEAPNHHLEALSAPKKRQAPSSSDLHSEAENVADNLGMPALRSNDEFQKWLAKLDVNIDMVETVARDLKDKNKKSYDKYGKDKFEMMVLGSMIFTRLKEIAPKWSVSNPELNKALGKTLSANDDEMIKIMGTDFTFDSLEAWELFRIDTRVSFRRVHAKILWLYFSLGFKLKTEYLAEMAFGSEKFKPSKHHLKALTAQTKRPRPQAPSTSDLHIEAETVPADVQPKRRKVDENLDRPMSHEEIGDLLTRESEW
ncbi:hypothetical protein PsorP6_016419 [Peronosclerospora sorghi]|uniref:Uncharacterized protein n=1 Tax=Peronosclerospora sorghi TaxID=230839 RepID=A0ACC0VJL2_9STRA|nr:hypothetical protein PsorP6_016419 [Peronosclerospora sorghi]